MTVRHPLIGGLLALPVLLFLHLLIGNDLPAPRIAALTFGAPPDGFGEVRFLYAAMPRAAMAVIAGLALGVAGSLMQQVTQMPTVLLPLSSDSWTWMPLCIPET